MNRKPTFRLALLGNLAKRPAERGSVTRRVLWGCLFFVLFAILVVSGAIPERYDFRLGQVAPEDVYAPRTIVDRWETDRLKREAAARVSDVYELDKRINEEAQEELAGLFAEIRRIRGLNANFRSKLEELKVNRVLSALSEAELGHLLRLDEESFNEFEVSTRILLRKVMDVGIKEQALPAFIKQMETEAGTVGLEPQLQPIAAFLAKSYLRPNMVLNLRTTLMRREEAMAAVEPVRVLEGELIVGRGQRVSERHLRLLDDLGLRGTGGSRRVVVGGTLLAVLLTCLMGLSLYRFERRVLQDETMVVMTGISLVMPLAMAKVLAPISDYLAPAALGGILLAMLVRPRAGLVGGFVLSLAVAALSGFEFRYAVVGFAGVVAGVLGVSRSGHRMDVLKAGALAGLASATAIFALSLVLEPVPVWEAVMNHLYGITSGVMSGVLATGMLPLFEALFGVVTPIKLLELANPHQPLLRRLLIEAPGTYHHSVVVANLAEAAAQAVGGDPLLARVGAYYHDVGKMKRPYFFVENQFSGENPHDKMSPSLSVLILGSHVRDGVELAREAKLPASIIDFIREHHGTTFISYFYTRVAENGKQEKVPEEDFRYDGPRPRRKETAIVMLADSAEGAVRALLKPTPGRIDSVVRRIIRDRLDDHQLDECDLTFKELDVIASTFVRVLTGFFHPRLEYPEAVIREAQKREARKAHSLRVISDSGE